jgi:acyl carrier protein
MLPAHYVQLPKLPLTPNGKLDRKALPAPNPEAALDAARHLAPRTPTESRIAAIWSDALGMTSPGVIENFFDVGGDSLKAAQMVTALRATFVVDVGMRHLFERPTVAGLAEIVDVLAVSTPDAARGLDDEREQIEI